MKKIKFILLITFLIFGLTSCKSDKTVTNKTVFQIGEEMLDSQKNMMDMMQLVSGNNTFYSYLSEQYMIDKTLCDEGLIIYADGARAEEMAVIFLKEEGKVAQVKELLQEYITKRTGDFNGYAPEQVKLLGNAQVVSHGKYIALMICYDVDSAKKVFDAAFDTSVKDDAIKDIIPVKDKKNLNDKGYVVFKQPNKEDMTIYDTSAIIEASINREKISTLSDKDKKILEICEFAISKVIKKNMTDFEKELAIHDFIIQWASYDPDALSRHGSQSSTVKSDNTNPYGLLVNKKSICIGYATTFQLFMDLLDIECITISGAAWNSTEDHAWNMVKIDDVWYCVDVTWDDPIGIDEGWGTEEINRMSHKYFNVNSQTMRDSDHQWDYENVPEAN